jgi:hypothetical protein
VPSGVTGFRELLFRTVRAPGVALVVVGVLAGSAAMGSLLNGATFSDTNRFAAFGRILFSTGWEHTYAQPWVQAGPFELLICLLAHALSNSATREAITLNLFAAAALLGVARVVLGRRWQPLLVVGVGALGLRVISDVGEVGHPSGLLITLAWLLAARAARRDQALLAGLLLGLSAGFETWGLLGAPVLLLIPRLKGTAAAAALALAVAGAIYTPFLLGGDFHMLHLHWDIAGGLDARLFGPGHAFTWSMRLMEAVIVVGAGSASALVLRRHAPSVWIVPAVTSICRLMLDPVHYGYYWDTSITLILIGTASWFAFPRSFAGTLHETLRTRGRPALDTRSPAGAPARFDVPAPG